MIDAYRTAAPMPREAVKRWTFGALISAGEYYAAPLYADRWTGPVAGHLGSGDPRLGPQLPEQDLDASVPGAPGEKYCILRRWEATAPVSETILDASRRGMRMATLRELLWLGIAHMDYFRGHGCVRLYAAGSFAWHHWRIDGLWTASIPYLSDCAGRVRLRKVDKILLPSEPSDEPVTFLAVYRDA